MNQAEYVDFATETTIHTLNLVGSKLLIDAATALRDGEHNRAREFTERAHACCAAIEAVLTTALVPS